MSENGNYWFRRATAQRLSRRRFVGGAALAGVGAASLGLVGCGDDDDTTSTATSAPSGGGTTPGATGGSPTAGSGGSPTAAPATKQVGGIARFSSANSTYDTFDADRSRFGPTGTIFGLANQSVVAWDSYKDSKISGYFAESFEQPDKTSFTFKVRKNLFWHDKPPVNGRAANANDIVYHIQRNKAGKLKDGSSDANFYRQPLFALVDTVSAVDTSTVKVTLTKPWPFFLNTLAQTWTKVQAPEAVDKFEADYSKYTQDQIIGTGDYVLTKFSNDGTVSFRRFDKAFHKSSWDGIDLVPLFTDPAALQAAFEQKQIDSFAPSQQAVVDDLNKRLNGKIYEKDIFTANPVTGTYYGGAAPWSDQRLIGAIYQVMDRRGLIQQLLQGRGAISAFIPPAWAPYALSEKELITFPGYLADRDKDIADAKAKWAAGGGDKLGEVTIDIPDIFEGLYAGVSSLITNQLKSALGNTFTPKIQPYSTITSKLVAQQYGNGSANTWFGWGNPPSDPDPTVDFINAFNSKSSQYPQWNVPLPGMDDLTDKMSSEFDVNKRIDLNMQASRILLNNTGGGITPLLEGISNILYWNYFKNSGETTFQITYQNWARDLWFDQKDPTWSGRPT